MRRSLNQGEPLEPAVRPEGAASRSAIAGAILILGAALSSTSLLRAQTTAPTQPPHPTSIIHPEANRPPDKNDQMLMGQRKEARENFDKVNQLRTKEIADEATKLLILANDLKLQMDNLSDHTMTRRLMREAEVIELLAHDVQKKMILIVGGS